MPDPTPAPTNGNGTAAAVAKRTQAGVWALALSLGACVLIQGALGALIIFHPPQDWNLMNKAFDHLGQLDILLAGGLLGQGFHRLPG
jgi:hypothetical protein